MIRRRRLFLAAWVACAGAILFSGPAPESSAGTDKIVKEARETVDATREYTAQQKEAFQQKVHEELAAVQKQISALQGKARDVSSATRADLQESIAELEKKRDAAREQLNTLRAATDDKWNSLKTGMDAALDEIKSSYRKAVSRLP
jgi:peptidoglycan hydrolase CwlO-like protein